MNAWHSVRVDRLNRDGNMIIDSQGAISGQSQGFQRHPELLKLQQDSNGLYRIYLENLAKISFSHMGFQHLEKKVP